MKHLPHTHTPPPPPMGCQPSALNSEDCVGAYAYNACTPCCGGMWFEGGGCWGCRDGKRFSEDPAWEEGTQLRNSFETMLNSEEMLECLENAPKSCTFCCGGCRNVENMSPALNKDFCKRANEKLLNPAGYRCEAYHWITYNNKGERQEHMVIAIFKNR